MADIAAWLAGLGLEKYAGAFAEHEIDFDLLPLLTETDIKELGLPIGPRRKLLEAIGALHGAIPSRHDKPEQGSEAERRQLTIMFVDLVNSTPLALRLDPENMREVLRAFQDAVVSKIGGLGYVAKLMGDGVLTYFGWPRAHEDDPKRAVSAALAITDAVSRLVTPVGEKLACRVGIATGLVVVGDIIGEGSALEHAVVGPTANLAARLQEAASPGEVMIAAATQRLLGSSFAVEAVGERQLKGHAEPIPLFRVLRRELHKSRFVARDEDDLGPIVGRKAELAALRLAWEQAKSGRGRTVLLTGEAGIGKSRLLQALADIIADDKPVRQVFHCSPLHSDNPFWPVVQQLASAAAIVEHGMDDGHGRNRLSRYEAIDALVGQLLDIVRAGPALIVFEDTQWADRATVELMRRLAGTVAGATVLLIVTSRPDGEPHLGADANLSRLALPRLDRPEAGALVALVAGRHQLSARLASEILARSDGIPLFIEEVTKAVIESAPAGQAVSVPATLRDSLIARLDGSPVMKAAAQIAACIGRDFDEALLLSISDIAPRTLQEGLAALLQAGHIVAQGTGWFRFKHALLCDIAYETLLTPRRQKLHRRIAEALEALPDNLAEREPESLARHWFAAGQSEQAEIYWLRARHRVAHWQEQLDALADYLEADTAEIIPIHGGLGVRKLH